MKINPILSKYNLTFGYAKTPVYKINANGEYQRYNSLTEAACENNVDKSNISKCIKGQMPLYLNAAYCLAQVIDEKEDKDEAIENIKNERFFGKKPSSAYVINLKGEVQVFETLTKAASELKTSLASIQACSKGRAHSFDGYVLLRQHEVIDENGEFDAEKAEKIVTEKFLNSKLSPVYAVDEDNNYKRYESIIECANDNLVNQSNVSSFISYNRKARKGLVYIKASEVESFKIGQGFVLDEEKLISLSEKQRFKKKEKAPAPISKRKTPIYAFKDGVSKPMRFESIQGACDEYGITNSRISDCLRGKFASASNIVFVYADEIETLNEQNEPVLDKAKVSDVYLEKNDKRRLHAVCEITQEGEVVNVQNFLDLRKEIKFSKEEYAALSELGIIEKDGKIYVNKTKIEKIDDDCEIVFDNEKIMELLKENKKNQRKRFVYAVNKDFSYDVFEDIKQAVEAYGAKRANIAMCLSGNSKTALGKVFVYASDVEGYDKDNNPYFNYEKFLQVLKERNCESYFLSC